MSPRPYTSQAAALRPRSHFVADILLLLSVFAIIGLLAALLPGVNAPLDVSDAPSVVSTDPINLPYYAARSLLRMFTALFFSVIFTFIYALAAARSRRAGKILIPILDILQSVPVLGFLSATITIWFVLFPNSMLGLEAASVFAIFTSQAWNMTFSFYYSLTSQASDLDEAARSLRLTRWQRFWKLDVPGGMIPLVWNGMMSFGGGWFFLVASEMISVNNHTYALPGIGSYVAVATAQQQMGNILLAIGVMILMVVGVNFLFWRPLTAWAERFRTGDSASAEEQHSLVLDVLRRSAIPEFLEKAWRPVSNALDWATRPFGRTDVPYRTNVARRRGGDIVLGVIVGALLLYGLWRMGVVIQQSTGLGEVGQVFLLGLATLSRVVVLLIVSTLIWVPVGVWIGMNPKVTRFAQPIVQVLASFPANFLFPFITLALIATGISLNIGGIFLMALGAQWYILFNVIAGASAIPNDLREAAASLRLPWRLRWKTLILPAIFSSWVTGGITAAGGAWNASIVAEVVTYGSVTLTAYGLGAYISEATATGDMSRVLLGVAMMSVFVVGINRIFWHPLHRLAEGRFSL